MGVVVLVVDDLVVVNDVGTVGGDDTHDSLITQVVLSRYNEVDFGRRHLRGKLDVLRVASGFGNGEDVPSTIGVFLHQANHAACRGCDADFAQTGNDDFRMGDFHFLRHLGVDAEEGVAVGGEHSVGNVFVVSVVRP